MASLITVRLYDEDGNPKTGATPKLSAIREKDNVKVLNLVDMVEVSDGFYKYNFTKYNKSELYFFFIDGEQYDDVNKLDAYGNKDTRGRYNSIIIDEEKLAKNIWNAKASENNKEGTMGAIVQSPISFVDIILEINKIQSQAEDIANILAKEMKVNMDFSLKKEIGKIKIPENNIDYNKIENIVDYKINGVKDLVKESLDEYENKDEYKEQYDDSNVKSIMQETTSILNGLINGLNIINNKIEGMSKQDLVDGVIKVDIRGLVNKITEGNIDKIDSMGIKVSEDIKTLKKGILNLSAKLDN